MSGFDNKCPHCEADIDDMQLYAIWQSCDCGDQVIFDCPYCKAAVQMQSHVVMEFEIEKPETEEEYQAKRAEMIARQKW